MTQNTQDLKTRIRQFKCSSEFDSKSSEWPIFLERFNLELQLQDLSGDTEELMEGRRNLLLKWIGPETFKILVDHFLPDSILSKSFNDIVSFLNSWYCPVTSYLTERLKFRSITRKPNQTISHFVNELRGASKHCKFGATLDEQIRDQFLFGLQDAGFQEELLRRHPEGSDKLQLIIESALLLENAKRQTQKLEGVSTRYSEPSENLQLKATVSRFPHVPPPANAKKHCPKEGRAEVTKPAKPCYRCDSKDHSPSQCKFAKAKCHHCGKLGHIEKACFSKKHARKGKVNLALDSEQQSEQEPEQQPLTSYTLNAQCTTRQKPFIVEVLINHQPVNMEIDSGSAFSLLSEEQFNKLFTGDARPPLNKSNIILKTWNHETLKIRGETEVSVQLQKTTVKLPLLVVAGKGTNLLGRNWFSSLGLTIQGIGVNNINSQLELLIQRYDTLFQEELGAATVPSIKLDLDPNCRPIFLKHRSIPLALREKVNQALDNLIAQDILEPVQFSEWATPIVPVVKKDGSIRICGDYKCTVNKAIKKDTYPLPTIEHIISGLSGSTVFSKLDLSQAYQQLKVDETSSRVLTLNTPKGLLRVKRLQFGINAAPNIFQRFMDSMLINLDGVFPYLDDILVVGRTTDEHNHRLEEVFRRLSNAGLKVNYKKCSFGEAELDYLGFHVSSRGTQPTTEKLDAIIKVPNPRNKTELRAFLGLLNFYGKFIPNRATVLEPLHRLLEQNARWKWDSAHQQAFDKAKKLLISTEVLTFFDPSKPIILSCDASSYGLGAVLSHLEPDGSEKPIAYTSRTLTKTERGYAQIDKEALAIIDAVKKFHHFLYARRFQIITDHKPLLSLLQNGRQLPQVISPRLLRWSLLLSSYDYELIYRSGKSLENADSLSRLPVPSGEFRIDPPGDILLLEAAETVEIADADEVARYTRKDPILSRVLQWALKGFPDRAPDSRFTPYFNRRHEITTHRGCLLWGCRVIIPPKLRTRVLEILHDSHPGMVLMKSLARSYVWWPNLDEFIENAVRNCGPCQENARAPPKAPTYLREVTERPWSRLHIDVAGPFKGNYFLIVVDSHSKWLEVKRIYRPCAEIIIRELRVLFACHGLPHTIVSDNGSVFTSTDFRRFADSNNCKCIFIPPAHPSSNGQAERMIQTTKKALKTMAASPEDLDVKLSRFLLRQHITPCTTTNYSPAELLMKRRLRSLLDSLHPDHYASCKEQQRVQAANMDAFQRTRLFQPDEHVYMRNFSSGPKWLPATISRITGPVSYELNCDGRLYQRHVDHIRKDHAH